MNADQGLNAAQLQDMFKTEHPIHTIAQWRAGPAEEHDSNGYWDWVATMVSTPVNTSNVVPLFVNAVPAGAPPIADMDSFAMLVDQWHGQCMENGNRVLELGVEGVVISIEDETNPGVVVQLTLDLATAHAFRLGAMTALNLFKDLPFGASLEDAPDDAAG